MLKSQQGSSIRRQSTCDYTEIANILQSLPPERPKPRHYSWSTNSLGRSNTSDREVLRGSVPQEATTFDTPTQNVEPTAIHAVLNADEEHPFQNYWTRGGGLAEVVNALPSKEHAFSLVAAFFSSIDPLYPVISRSQLMAELEDFWSLSQADMYEYEAGKLALHFVIYAAGVQSVEDLDPDERSSMADFYLSASHQSLCLCSYLSRFTLGTMKTMILIGYFLINTHRFWEAWTFSGILVRQAYGSQLNRSLSAISPNPSPGEEQLWRVLWQAITIQDVNLAFYLQLAPATAYGNVEQRQFEPIVETSASSMWAPGEALASSSTALNIGREADSDLVYLQSSFQYALFVQEHVSFPVALKRPICTSLSHRATLVARFRDMYDNWQAPFNSLDPRRFDTGDIRLARQLIAVSSNFFGVLAVLYMDKNPDVELYPDVYGAIEATHEALSAFFALLRLCPSQVDMWGGYHTRAYSQAVRLGNLLVVETQQQTHSKRDPRLMLGKSDLGRYLDILRISHASRKQKGVQETRYQTLKRLTESIDVG